MKIDDLLWDEWNLPHAEKHGCSPPDAEYIALGEHVYYTASYKNRDVILGPAPDGRILAVILGRVPNVEADVYYVDQRDARNARTMSSRSDNQAKKRPIDFGYPTLAQGNVPAFQDIEEEMAFWDTHDTIDFADDLSKSTYAPDRKTAPISVRLDRTDHARLKAEAEKMGIGPSTLARIWIKEKLAG